MGLGVDGCHVLDVLRDGSADGGEVALVVELGRFDNGHGLEPKFCQASSVDADGG